jgi:hypothetical protein
MAKSFFALAMVYGYTHDSEGKIIPTEQDKWADATCDTALGILGDPSIILTAELRQDLRDLGYPTMAQVAQNYTKNKDPKRSVHALTNPQIYSSEPEVSSALEFVNGKLRDDDTAVLYIVSRRLHVVRLFFVAKRLVREMALESKIELRFAPVTALPLWTILTEVRTGELQKIVYEGLRFLANQERPEKPAPNMDAGFSIEK